MRDLYKVLGVAKDADEKTIKKAYRALAKRNHPDLNPEDAAAEARFKEASAAYEVLSDAARRADYDEFGEDALKQGFDAEQARAWKAAQGQRGGPGFSGFGGQGFGAQGFGAQGFGGQGFDPADLFGDLFGQGMGARGARHARGQDLRAEVELDFESAALGAQHEFHFEGGKRLKVKIPSGVEDGETLRLRGKGGEAPAGQGEPGDLLLTIQVCPSQVFERDGLDVHTTLALTVSEAVLGASVRVPTLSGAVSMKIPAGAQSGKKLRMKGKGIKRGKRSGDLYVRLEVHVPTQVTEEVERALRTLEAAYIQHPRSQEVVQESEAA